MGVSGTIPAWSRYLYLYKYFFLVWVSVLVGITTVPQTEHAKLSVSVLARYSAVNKTPTLLLLDKRFLFSAMEYKRLCQSIHTSTENNHDHNQSNVPWFSHEWREFRAEETRYHRDQEDAQDEHGVKQQGKLQAAWSPLKYV